MCLSYIKPVPKELKSGIGYKVVFVKEDEKSPQSVISLYAREEIPVNVNVKCKKPEKRYGWYQKRYTTSTCKYIPYFHLYLERPNFSIFANEAGYEQVIVKCKYTKATVKGRDTENNNREVIVAKEIKILEIIHRRISCYIFK